MEQPQIEVPWNTWTPNLHNNGRENRVKDLAFMRMPKMAMMRMSKKMPGRVLIHKEGDRYHYHEPYRPPFKDPIPNAIPFQGHVRYALGVVNPQIAIFLPSN